MSVDDVASIFTRLVVCACLACARVLNVELFNGVLPVGKPTRRAVASGVRKLGLGSA